MAATLTFLGAAGGVTGSCIQLDAGGARLLIDCGAFQGDDEPRDGGRLPDPASLAGVILTHGHLDHVGRLPSLAKGRFKAPVLAHAATHAIARLILEDGVKIAARAGRHDPGLCDARDIEAVFALARAVDYGKPVRLGPFAVTLYDAGHILGSASVRVAWSEEGQERAVLFSGDLGAAGSPLLRPPYAAFGPADAVDAVVVESTYGDREHPPREKARASFRDAIRHALSDGGKVLVPAFAVGRTQELLYELNTMVEAHEIPGVPVVVDGPLGIDITALYQRHKGLYNEEALALLRRGDVPLEFRDLYSAREGRASDRVKAIDGPAIIIAGSGMCNGGRIVGHLVEFLPDPRTDVIFVGYQGHGTVGRALQDGAKTISLGGEEVDVRACVRRISGLSAHADRKQLVAWLGRVPRREGAAVYINHGEDEALAALAREVGRLPGTRAAIAAYGQTVTV